MNKDNVIEIEKKVKIGNFILEKGDKIKILSDKSAFQESIKKSNKVDICEGTKVTPERRKTATQFMKKSSKKVSYIDDEVVEFEDGFKDTWERFANAEYRITNKWIKPYMRAATNTYISKYGEMPPYME
jgi:hypothetical protein